MAGGANRMHLREALDQIAEIRQRMAASELFRGYRSLPIAFSGLLAFGGGMLQFILLPDPIYEVRSYVLLWSGVALLSLLATALTMWLRNHFAGPSHTRAVTWLALRQFVPSLFGGAIVTIAIVRIGNDAAWLLPGIWQLFFSQGIFASCRLLPRPIFVVGIFYFVTGSASLFVFDDTYALSPWAMILPFGIGQFFAAALLYLTLERRDAVETET
jgi:hypothetical protein